MASIDKIYGSQEQYDYFYNWCEKRAPFLLNSFYPRDGYDSNDRPIAMFGDHEDRWLWKCCCIPFVWERLKEQYCNGPRPHPKHWVKWNKVKRSPRYNRKSWGLYQYWKR